MPILADEEYEFNGLVIGGGTDYAITLVEGLDEAVVREEALDKAADHGSFVYAQFLEPRRITLQGEIMAHTVANLATMTDALKRAFSALENPLPLGYKHSGEVQKRVNCHPIRRAMPRTVEASLGYAVFTVQLLAGDPRLYDESESTITADGDAENEGSFPSPPIVTITGAAVNPRITNTRTGLFVQINETLVGGDSLVIDFAERTVEKNGVSIYHSFDPSSRWWQLEPGSNDIEFTGITGTKELAWRSAWS